jgi:hypothetical protein
VGILPLIPPVKYSYNNAIPNGQLHLAYATASGVCRVVLLAWWNYVINQHINVTHNWHQVDYGVWRVD